MINLQSSDYKSPTDTCARILPAAGDIRLTGVIAKDGVDASALPLLNVFVTCPNGSVMNQWFELDNSAKYGVFVHAEFKGVPAGSVVACYVMNDNAGMHMEIDFSKWPIDEARKKGSRHGSLTLTTYS